MYQIWKYPIPVEDRLTLEIPEGGRVLSVQVQKGVPCVWVLVNPKYGKVNRDFVIYGTGHPIPDSLGDYIGTFQLLEGELVFHLFSLT